MTEPWASLHHVIHWASYWSAILSALSLGGFLIFNLLRPSYGFWPAPDKSGWKHHVALGLFRLFCGATVLFALMEIAHNDWGAWWNYALGLPLMGAAYGVTLWGYRSLGIENTYFGAEGLVTGGLYAYSRNPQYVSSVMATMGLAVTAGSWPVCGLSLVLFAIYTGFALNEERWLTQGYGQAFRDYMHRTPRFLGLRSLERAREEMARG